MQGRRDAEPVHTRFGALNPCCHLADLVLVLTVNPGFSGQKFMPEVLPKIAELRRKLDEIDSSAWLEVDGGISSATLPQVREAGANAFVSGSFRLSASAGDRGGDPVSARDASSHELNKNRDLKGPRSLTEE